MNKIKLLIPVLALSSLSICSLPMISMVGCGNPDKPEPIPPEPSTQPFETCDWSYINEKATSLENNQITQEEFCNSFTINNKTPTSIDEFIGAERRVQLEHQDIDGDNDPQDYTSGSEVAQTVRVIGTCIDDASQYQVNKLTNNKVVALTFDFADLISDENGYSLACFWNGTRSPDQFTNNNYFYTDIRENIYGVGSGWEPEWYGKGDSRKATASTHPNYYNKTVYEMLPDELANILKEPQNRYINIRQSGWGQEIITDKLFLPTICEYSYDDQYERAMRPYKYYYDWYQPHEQWIKQQIKGKDGALTSKQEIDDAEYITANKIYSSAGWAFGDYDGSEYWLSSPEPKSDGLSAVNIHEDGEIYMQHTYDRAYGVAPAFCI